MCKTVSYTEIIKEWRDTYKEKAHCQDSRKKTLYKPEMKSVTFKKKTKNLLSLALQSSSLEMMAHEMFCNKQMYPLGTIHIIDPQARREEIEKHRLEKSCKKTSISASLSSFKMQL